VSAALEPATPPPAGRLQRRRRWKKAGVRLAARLVPSAYVAWMRLVVATSRVIRIGMDEMLARSRTGTNVALAILHQDIVVGPYLFRDLGILTLANVGDAGDLIAASLARIGYEAARGGSSRSATRRTPALEAMIERIDALAAEKKSGVVYALTPDGSQGPAGSIKSGVIVLAARTGSEIYCLNVHASRAFYAPTWDRTAIPLPFSTITIELEGPIGTPAADASPEEIEKTRREVEARLHAMHARAFAREGRTPLPALTPATAPNADSAEF